MYISPTRILLSHHRHTLKLDQPLLLRGIVVRKAWSWPREIGRGVFGFRLALDRGLEEITVWSLSLPWTSLSPGEEEPWSGN